MIKLSKIWRLFATGLSFFMFSFGGAILSYIYLPLISFFIKDEEKRIKKAQFAIYVTFKMFIGMLSLLGIFRFRFEGIEKLKEDRGCIFIANHPTLIDYVSIVSHLPQCDNMVKKELWENPYYGHVVNSAGYIPNIDAEQTLERLKEIFSEGRNLLMFPEGTRTVPGVPIKLQRGAAQLAIRTDAQIRMIHIDCTPVTLTKGSKWYNIPDTKPTLKVAVGDKINTAEFLEQADGLPSLAARRLTRCLQEQLSKKI